MSSDLRKAGATIASGVYSQINGSVVSLTHLAWSARVLADTGDVVEDTLVEGVRYLQEAAVFAKKAASLLINGTPDGDVDIGGSKTSTPLSPKRQSRYFRPVVTRPKPVADVRKFRTQPMRGSKAPKPRQIEYHMKRDIVESGSDEAGHVDFTDSDNEHTADPDSDYSNGYQKKRKKKKKRRGWTTLRKERDIQREAAGAPPLSKRDLGPDLSTHSVDTEKWANIQTYGKLYLAQNPEAIAFLHNAWKLRYAFSLGFAPTSLPPNKVLTDFVDRMDSYERKMVSSRKLKGAGKSNKSSRTDGLGKADAVMWWAAVGFGNEIASLRPTGSPLYSIRAVSGKVSITEILKPRKITVFGRPIIHIDSLTTPMAVDFLGQFARRLGKAFVDFSKASFHSLGAWDHVKESVVTSSLPPVDPKFFESSNETPVTTDTDVIWKRVHEQLDLSLTLGGDWDRHAAFSAFNRRLECGGILASPDLVVPENVKEAMAALQANVRVDPMSRSEDVAKTTMWWMWALHREIFVGVNACGGQIRHSIEPGQELVSIRGRMHQVFISPISNTSVRTPLSSSYSKNKMFSSIQLLPETNPGFLPWIRKVIMGEIGAHRGLRNSVVLVDRRSSPMEISEELKALHRGWLSPVVHASPSKPAVKTREAASAKSAPPRRRSQRRTTIQAEKTDEEANEVESESDDGSTEVEETESARRPLTIPIDLPQIPPSISALAVDGGYEGDTSATEEES